MIPLAMPISFFMAAMTSAIDLSPLNFKLAVIVPRTVAVAKIMSLMLIFSISANLLRFTQQN